MDDLKLMTVRALRELAKSHLGAGFSRLKTKAELIAALTKKLAVEAKAVIEDPDPQPPVADPRAAERAPSPAPAAQPSAAEKTPAAPALAKTRDGAGVPESEALAAEAESGAEPARAETDAAPEAAGATSTTAEESAPAEAEEEDLLDDPPPVVAPPPRVMSQAEIDLINENLGELPSGYHDDSVVLLPRDPHTLWVCWDFAEETARKARSQLPNARAVIRLFDDGHLVREVDVALESRSWYLHHVTPGRRYRAELAFVGEGQPPRRLGPSSTAILVPGEGPSPVIDDRFISLPYEVPFVRSSELLDHAKPGAPFSRASQDALIARAEEGLQMEGLREDGAAPVGETVEIYHQLVQGLGGSETMVEVMKRRTRFGGLWTSSRPAAAWTSSKPG